MEKVKMKKWALLRSVRWFKIIFLIGFSFFIISCDQEEEPVNTVVQTKWEDQAKKDGEETDKNIKKEGPLTVVITTVEKPPKVVKNTPRRYSVQAGAFLKSYNAQKVKQELKKLGYPAYIAKYQDENQNNWKSVRIGSFKSKSEAQELQGQLVDKEKIDAVVRFDRHTSQNKIKAINVISDSKTPAKIFPSSKAPAKIISGSKTQFKFRNNNIPIRKPIKLNKSALTPTKGDFSFQIGGLFTEKNALKLSSRLKKKGYKPFIKRKKDNVSNDIWFTVHIGFWPSLERASMAAELFNEKESFFAKVIL